MHNCNIIHFRNWSSNNENYTLIIGFQSLYLFTLEVKYQGFLMASNYTQHIAGRIVWALEVLSLWLGDKPSGEGGSVTPLVVQVYFRDHTGSFNNPNMDIRSGITKHHSDFRIGSSFWISSAISHISVTRPSHWSINDSNLADRKYAVYHSGIDNGCGITIVKGHFHQQQP